MGAMFVVLSDRSPAVKDKCAATIAVLFRYDFCRPFLNFLVSQLVISTNFFEICNL